MWDINSWLWEECCIDFFGLFRGRHKNTELKNVNVKFLEKVRIDWEAWAYIKQSRNNYVPETRFLRNSFIEMKTSYNFHNSSIDTAAKTSCLEILDVG